MPRLTKLLLFAGHITFVFFVCISLARAQAPTDITFVPSEATCNPLPDFQNLPCGSMSDPVLCQQAKDAKKTTCEQINASGSPVWRFLLSTYGAIEKYLIEVVSAALILGLSAATIWFKTLADGFRKRISDPFFKRPVDYINRGINIIVIGEGKSGKTTIIHTLSGSDEANPEISTDSYKTYTLVHEINVEASGKTKRDVYRLYFDDYVGQKFDDAVNNPMLESRRKIVPASALLIVVDLFLSTPPARNGPFDRNRIAAQNAFYTNEGILQILSRMLGNGKHIILFINKIDLALPRTSVDLTAAAKEAYAPIVNSLQRLRGKQLSVVVGSAMTGQGVVGYDGGVDKQRSLFKIFLDAAESLDGWEPA